MMYCCGKEDFRQEFTTIQQPTPLRSRFGYGQCGYGHCAGYFTLIVAVLLVSPCMVIVSG